MPLCRRAIALLLVLFLIPLTSAAGLRGRGKYSGVVFFNRWGDCVLISSVYLTYVSQAVKDDLRPYAGQAVQLDVTDIVQRMNPGDALIRKYAILGPAPEGYIKVQGLTLTSTKDFAKHENAFLIEVRNTSSRPTEILPGELGLTVFGTWKNEFTPSDGPSSAAITRASLLQPTGGMKLLQGSGYVHSAYRVQGGAITSPTHLEPGASLRLRIVLDLSPGEYQFLFGYGGGVHESTSLISNSISFIVDSNGAAIPIE